MRIRQTINSHWQFHRGELGEGYEPVWENIHLPHTWNAQDLIADDERNLAANRGAGAFAGYGTVGSTGYYRGVGWYRKYLEISASDRGQRLFLYFDGVNQNTTVLVNGEKIGCHLGGYTAFCFEITTAVRFGAVNEIRVRVSNAHNEAVPPVGGDLGHFGGIYRHVYLVKTGSVHFDLTHFASPGVFVDTPQVSPENAVVRVRTRVQNQGDENRRLGVVSEVLTADGELVSAMRQEVYVAPGTTNETEIVSAPLAHPRLWSPESPNLYQVRHRLEDVATGEVLDELTTPLGFRWFTLDAERGFALNDQSCFIRGIGRHQDYSGLGYAVPYEVLKRDVLWIKELGANAMRGHYPLTDAVYDECDRLGVMCWVKIVIMDRIMSTPEFLENTRNMLREMILQLYNHPAIVFWGHACEMLGDADWFWPKPQDPLRLQEHFTEARRMAQNLEDLTKALDPQRLTGNDFHTDPNPQWYRDSGLTEVNDFNGWNIYQGWYHRDLDGLGEMLERTRAFAPHRPYLIAEYGAGTDLWIHTQEPTIYDMSPEYADLFHQAYLREVKKRPWIAGLFIWTLVDFQRTSNGDSMKHINNKGLLTGDRRAKDTYYLYKAHWNPTPMVHIAEHDWPRRVGLVKADGVCLTPIRVYSNQPEVELFHNGHSLGVRRVQEANVCWEVPMIAGSNTLYAVSCRRKEEISDYLEIDWRLFPHNLRNWTTKGQKLCVNVGQSRTMYHDPLTDDRWLPDRAYVPGSYGHVGGRYYRHWPNMLAWHGIRDGVRHAINRTDLQAVFQTFVLGLKEYRLDVPDGWYRVGLYFCEPFPQAVRIQPEQQTGAAGEGRRVFDVWLNDRCMLEDLDLAEQFGERVAVTEWAEVPVTGGGGIRIRLDGRIGEPLLNGVTVEHC